jgi:uncharacterized protein (DUF433 family)
MLEMHEERFDAKRYERLRVAWPALRGLATEGGGDDSLSSATQWPILAGKGCKRRLLMSARLDRITIDPAIMNGQPCIRGMRLTVRRVVETVALYPDREELLREYPELEPEDIRQALEFAASNLDDEVISLGAA